MRMTIIFLIGMLVLGCTGNGGGTQMNEKLAKSGDVVSVDYIGTLDDGTVFDTNIESVAKEAGHPPRDKYEPLTFIIGKGQVLKKFEETVIGMKVGDEKEVRIIAEEAYGKPNPKNVLTTDVSEVGGGTPKVGMIIYHNSGSKGIVTKVEGDNITIDFNHPLAGKDLNFKITLREIK